MFIMASFVDVGGLWSFSQNCCLVHLRAIVSIQPVSLPPVYHLFAYYETGEMN